LNRRTQEVIAISVGNRSMLEAPKKPTTPWKRKGMIATFSSVAGGVTSDLEVHAARGQLEAAPALVERLGMMVQE
jgi:hypothetical protein